MSDLSEEDSSDDSSKEFLVNPEELNLNSSFFKTPKSKATRKKQQPVSDEESTDEDDGFHDVATHSSVELFSQVLQNLESSRNLTDDSGKQESSFARSQSGDQTLTSSNEITELLLRGEAACSSFKQDSDQSESQESTGETQAPGYSIPKEGIKITLPGSEILFARKKKKGAPDPLAILRKHFRETQLLVDKVSLLCWLGFGFHLNKLVNDPEVMSVCLSLMASSNYPKTRIDLAYLEKLTKWFSNLFHKESTKDFISTNKERLLKCGRDKKVSDYSELVMLFVALLRALGLNSRLVLSLCPPRKKLPMSLMSKTEKQNEDSKIKKKSSGKSRKNDSTEKEQDEKSPSQKLKVPNSSEARKAANMGAKKRAAEILKGKTKEKVNTKEEIKKEESKDPDPSGLSKLRTRRMAALEHQKDELISKTNTVKKEDSDSELESPPQPKRTTQRGKKVKKQEEETISKYYKEKKGNKTEAITQKRTRKNNSATNSADLKDDTVSKYYKKEEPVSSTETVPQKKARVTKAGLRTRAASRNQNTSKNIAEEHSDSETEFEDKKPVNKTKGTAVNLNANKQYVSEDSDSDSDVEFVPERKRKSRQKLTEANQQDKIKRKRRLLSSDTEEDDEENAKNKENLWVEVYMESEESWISVCLPEAKVHCVNELYKRARKPVLYVVAWNSQNQIKDVTRRYCQQWLMVTRKKRINEEWWSTALAPWKEKNSAISRAEDELLLERDLAQPLPKTVTECKGHPLYVLARHLLKYEALYPPDCVPLGHIKTGEAIYSRHCVHTLRSRETWVKHARVVKPNQDAYKNVKSLPKYDKLSGTKIKDATLELFGEWQTTEYIPPTAKDGIVPRNEYGNVDLFQRSMLPKGTVHINLPGLNRVARKLDIDCAPAVVGFNFGGMGAVPAFEGFIVCEEFEDTLREAWETEQVEAAKRAREKREKRVYGNWRRMIHGLFIRERLAAKYEFEEQRKTSNKRSKQKANDTKRSKDS